MKDLKLILLPIALLLLIVVGPTETVYGQASSTEDDCICYTDTMDKQAIECRLNAPKKDSLISNYSLQILNFKTLVSNQGTILNDNEVTISTLQDDNQKISLKLGRAVRNVKIFGVGGLVVGVVVGTIFLIK